MTVHVWTKHIQTAVRAWKMQLPNREQNQVRNTRQSEITHVMFFKRCIDPTKSDDDPSLHNQRTFVGPYEYYEKH